MVAFGVSCLQILWLLIIMPFVLQVQYGSPDKLCSPVVQAKKTGEDLVVRSYSSGYFFEIFFRDFFFEFGI